ncbi:hypothetical protein [Bordetella flabilis]|uniref:Uncharacterized protein n=1 Tax=Bordetella flabilis TaxID=463014 RepID=A0A193GND7_9BORD|nr:hypothetical protein [Bordetella flabilis]ANN80884.1 hypothetical protein BAU07_26550 [Bordetella flabilis]
MRGTNDYVQAVEFDGGIYAVELSTGGWSIADGPGSTLCEPYERELAGWHLPVRFDNEAQAREAIRTAPHVMFDIRPNSEWTEHCIACGGMRM